MGVPTASSTDGRDGRMTGPKREKSEQPQLGTNDPMRRSSESKYCVAADMGAEDSPNGIYGMSGIGFTLS